MTDLTTMPENYDNIRTGIVELLKAARSAAARNVNSIMTAAYWEIGRRIVILEQGGEHRAEYGEQLIEQLAGDLTRAIWPRIWASKSLANAAHSTSHGRTQDSPDTVWRICNIHMIQ